MPPFAHDSFVVVDVPATLAQHVRGIRRQYGSARQFLPVEITVAGSSGIGVFAPDQDADDALRVVGEIAAETQAIDFELSGVERFPGSGVFYYALRDPAPLVALHRRLAGSGLRFLPNKFPFVPHLTIDAFDDPSADLEAELRALAVPAGVHHAVQVSVYALHGWDCRVVRSFALRPRDRE